MSHLNINKFNISSFKRYLQDTHKYLQSIDSNMSENFINPLMCYWVWCHNQRCATWYRRLQHTTM